MIDSNYKERGSDIRKMAENLILDFLKSKPDTAPDGVGIQQTTIFRECGLDWGDHESAPSTQQQYWVIALLRKLEYDGKTTRDAQSKLWKLK